MLVFVGSPFIDIGIVMSFDGLGEFYLLGGGVAIYFMSPIIAIGGIEVSKATLTCQYDLFHRSI